ncbi:hypothetical protein lbkm_2330 [Lachnospiraceae bacterium KM106-2]|nr:hypothetical protein lbkm_2330 [Lachnospiraceae bacterium KM106-2]
MWIRTQNKKELVEVQRVNVARIFGDKKKKAILWGYTTARSLFSEGRVELGKYSSEEAAIAEMDRIEEYLVTNSIGVYQINNEE